MQTQQILVKVLDAPNAPNTGLLSGLADAATPSILLAVAACLAIVLPLAIILFRKTRRKTALFLPALIALPLLALAFAKVAPVMADTVLSLATENVTLTVQQSSLPTAASASATTTVTTDHPTGYTLSAKLSQPLEHGITASLNDEPLATELTAIFVDDTGDSPSTYAHTITLNLPAGLPVGEYAFDLIYDVAENPLATLQSFTAADCASLNLNEIVKMRDARDDGKYRIRKLADGKCWMIDDLKLAGITLSDADSNLAPGATFEIPADPVNGSASHANGACDGGGSVTPTGNYLTCDGTATQSATNSHFRVYSDPNLLAACRDNIAHASNTTGMTYNPASPTGCGYLYNWYTATAGSGVFGLTNTDVPYSICPAGWRLPTGGAGGEFAVLNGSMKNGSLSPADTDSTAAANWFPNGLFQGAHGGFYYNGSISLPGYYGTLWSRTAVASAGSAAGVFYSYDYGGSVTPGNDSSRMLYGFGVRCVAN
jgi:uncharacterized protein (TIGR02145 family)